MGVPRNLASCAVFETSVQPPAQAMAQSDVNGTPAG